VPCSRVHAPRRSARSGGSARWARSGRSDRSVRSACLLRRPAVTSGAHPSEAPASGPEGPWRRRRAAQRGARLPVRGGTEGPRAHARAVGVPAPGTTRTAPVPAADRRSVHDRGAANGFDCAGSSAGRSGTAAPDRLSAAGWALEDRSHASSRASSGHSSERPFLAMIPQPLLVRPPGSLAAAACGRRQPSTTDSSRGAAFRTSGPPGPQTTMSSIRAPYSPSK
jgi:hypothetical protein